MDFFDSVEITGGDFATRFIEAHNNLADKIEVKSRLLNTTGHMYAEMFAYHIMGSSPCEDCDSRLKRALGYHTCSRSFLCKDNVEYMNEYLKYVDEYLMKENNSVLK